MAESNVVAIASLSRLVLDLRLIALLLTVLWMPHGEADPRMLSFALAGAGVLSLYPLLRWDEVAPTLMRNPLLLGLDLAFVVWVLTITGPESPFLYYAVGTALLAGALYGVPGAVVFSVLLVAGHVWALDVRMPLASSDLSFHALVGLPALYPIAATAAAAVRKMLIHQRDVERALAERTKLAIGAEERSRLAREMHDSLAKTIHGIALSAAALPRWVERDPKRAAEGARGLSHAAERAAAEARELIGDLRSDRLDAPLHVATQRYVADWSAAREIDAVAETSDVGVVTASTRYEIFCILKEALRNVERHAQASQVVVRLRRDDDKVTLTVSDDGVGFDDAGDHGRLAADGHFGIVGMSERAERIGGRLDVSAHEGAGVSLTLTVPARQDRSHVAGTPSPLGIATEAVP